MNLCHILLTEHNDESLEKGESQICMTQMSVVKGIKMFGEKHLK